MKKKKYISPRLVLADVESANLLMASLNRGNETDGNAEVCEQDGFLEDVWGNY